MKSIIVLLNIIFATTVNAAPYEPTPNLSPNFENNLKFDKTPFIPKSLQGNEQSGDKTPLNNSKCLTGICLEKNTKLMSTTNQSNKVEVNQDNDDPCKKNKIGCAVAPDSVKEYLKEERRTQKEMEKYDQPDKPDKPEK